jgi:hypothetical protein
MSKINLLGTLRDKNRRREDRRSSFRRTIEHPFGSDRWVAVVRSLYAFWPKKDRRSEERRDLTRRSVERRTRSQKYRLGAFRPRIVKQRFPSQILTEEERQMLNDLNFRE